MRSSAELWPGRVRTAYAEGLGAAVTVEDSFGTVTVDVPADSWVDAVRFARDALGCRFFDFLSAVDEGVPTDESEVAGQGRFRLVCHVAALPADGAGSGVTHLAVRCLVGESAPSVAHVYAGARWHERETAEMFGISFLGPDGQPLQLETLLLPDGFEGHPLRKDFVLASRVAKPWPGAKEPGESDHDAAPSRRRTRPPGVPEDWRRG